MNKTTFWMVKVGVFGRDKPVKLWFNTRAEAFKEYNNSQFADYPVFRAYSNPGRIAEIEKKIEMQNQTEVF